MQNCPTCLEPLSSGSINYTVSTPCGHLFHVNCVQGWIARGNQSCPQCRSHISKEKLLRIYLQPAESDTQISKVSILRVVAFLGDCRDIPKDQGSYFSLIEDFLL